MRSPCAADLDMARELLEHGVVDEGARKLVDLQRCSRHCGCTDWQSCTHKVEGVWLETAKPRPDAEGLAGPGRKAR